MASKKPHLVQIDFQGARTKAQMLERIAAALNFPSHFGANLDALNDCLTDLPVTAKTPWRIEITHLASGAVGQSVLGVFTDAREHFQSQGATLDIVTS